MSSIQTATELSTEIVGSDGSGSDNFSNIMNPSSTNITTTTTSNNSKIQNLLSSNSQYYPQMNATNGKIGDLNTHRPIIQGNTNSANSTAFKITQVGPVIGSNVVVSRMESNNVQRPTSASPIPISGPLSGQSVSGNNFYFNPTTANAKPRSTNPPNNFYHSTANNVTKFTNMTVASAGAKNPLKPNHYTVPIPSTNPNSSNSTGNTNVTNNIVNLATHPNSNLSAPNTSGIAPKTTLKAADLIHILPNLFNTLKRRNSNSGASGASGNRNGNSSSSGSSGYFNNSNTTNALAAAVVAAASNSGKPISTSTAAALVAEQLLNVAASGPFSDDSSPSPPPQQHQNYPQYNKKIKLAGSALQCEICGKVYKHRNCLSKHMWEHHESWEHTKKSCQTKHQQVQLLEAAQVLSEIISGVRGSSTTSLSGNLKNSGSDESENEEEVDDEDDGEIVAEEMNGMEIIESAVGEEEENISIGGAE